MNLHRLRIAAFLLATFTLALPALAKVQPFPAGFRTQDIETNGATIHTRVGGQGPAVLLLHGFARYRRHVGAARGRAQRAITR